jgi:hypothetical protein
LTTDSGFVLALLDQRKIVFTVVHLFALSNPALMSALSKKSFSKVSLPTFASIFSMLGAGVPSAFSPKALAESTDQNGNVPY